MEQLIKKDRIQKLLADYMFTATKLLKEEKVKQAVEVLKAGFMTFRKWILEVCGLDIKSYCSIY